VFVVGVDEVADCHVFAETRAWDDGRGRRAENRLAATLGGFGLSGFCGGDFAAMAGDHEAAEAEECGGVGSGGAAAFALMRLVFLASLAVSSAAHS